MGGGYLFLWLVRFWGWGNGEESVFIKEKKKKRNGDFSPPRLRGCNCGSPRGAMGFGGGMRGGGLGAAPLGFLGYFVLLQRNPEELGGFVLQMLGSVVLGSPRRGWFPLGFREGRKSSPVFKMLQ